MSHNTEEDQPNGAKHLRAYGDEKDGLWQIKAYPKEVERRIKQQEAAAVHPAGCPNRTGLTGNRLTP
jgi:hypothetical protein